MENQMTYFDDESYFEDEFEPPMIDEKTRVRLENRLKRLMKDMCDAGINNIFINDGTLQCFTERDIHTRPDGSVDPDLAVISMIGSGEYPTFDGGATL